MNLSFCENLKTSRQRIGLTQQQIANALGITKSTYCGYETGKRQPDIPKLRRLSLLLCTSVDELLGLSGSDSDYVVTPTEYEQVMRFRTLDSYGQRMVSLVLAEESARMHKQMRENILSAAHDGAAPLLLATSPITCEWSAYLGPDGFRIVQANRDIIPASTAFALSVCGSSLMPRFHDQDILLVSSEKPQIGEIGVFIKDGRALVRLLGYSELLSINPAYLPIPLDETIRPCGTIVGVLSPADLL